MRLGVLLLCTAGCDSVFSVDHVAPPPPCDAIDHDEDGDDIDDACDPCPFSTENEGDDDEDGIALACDPDPLVANAILAFTGFEPRTRGQFTTLDGSFAADAFQVAGVGSSHMAWTEPLPEAGIWIVAGVDVAALEPVEYREVGFVLDATPHTSATNQTQYNGTMGVLGTTTRDYMQILARARPANDVAITTNTSPQVALAGFSGLLRAGYTRSATPAATLSVTTGAVETMLGGTPATPPPAGTVALYATSVDASFRFVMITTK